MGEVRELTQEQEKLQEGRYQMLKWRKQEKNKFRDKFKQQEKQQEADKLIQVERQRAEEAEESRLQQENKAKAATDALASERKESKKEQQRVQQLEEELAQQKAANQALYSQVSMPGHAMLEQNLWSAWGFSPSPTMPYNFAGLPATLPGFSTLDWP